MRRQRAVKANSSPSLTSCKSCLGQMRRHLSHTADQSFPSHGDDFASKTPSMVCYNERLFIITINYMEYLIVKLVI